MQGIKRKSSIVLLGMATALLIWNGLARQVVLETPASRRHSDWNQHWKAQTGKAELTIPAEPLPVNIPGPADKWSGNIPHSLVLNFQIQPGRYLLELQNFDAHEALPPRWLFHLNDQPIGSIRMPAGHGRPPPYQHINPNLAVQLPLRVPQHDNTLAITTQDGSWIAPARLRLLGRHRFYPAKLGWELLSRPALFGALATILLACTFFHAWHTHPVVRAAACVALTLFMSITSFVLMELVFRQFLINFPSARIVGEHQVQCITNQVGRNYTYATMIQPHPYLDIIYTLKPNLDGYFSGHPLKTNHRGMRGPEVQLKAAPETIRIMGLGDSVMFGWGVAWENTALKILGDMLTDELKLRVETLNLGCPSYNAVNEVASYARIGRNFKPQLVFLILLENDFGFPGAMIDPVHPWTIRKSYIHQQVLRWLAPKWRDGHAEYEYFVSTRHLDRIHGRQNSELTETQLWQRRVSEHYRSFIGTETMQATLHDLAAMLRADGALGIVLYHPLNIIPGRADSHEKHSAFVVESTRNAGMLAVDMTKPYENYLQANGHASMQEALWVHEHDWHPNETAHKLMALAAMEELKRSGLLLQIMSHRGRKVDRR